MWIRIKDKITYTTAWYKNHKGEMFEVTITDGLSSEPLDFYYMIKVNGIYKNFYINPIDIDIVEPRRLKINKIKNRCGLK